MKINLENLDKIEWESLTHAYGDASDVPAIIRKLAATDAEVRKEALGELYGNIWHQGTVYEATAYAVPFLIALLQDADVADKHSILVYLGALAFGNSYLDVHQHSILYEEERDKPEFQEQVKQELRWVKAAHEAVRKGNFVYAELLNNELPEVRAASAYLLGLFQEDAKQHLLWLRTRLESEKDEMVQAATIFAIGLLVASEPVAIDLLIEMVDSQKPVSLRVAAALGLAWSTPNNMPRNAVDLLVQTVDNPSQAKDVFEQFPWHGTDVQIYCSEALACIKENSEDSLPALIKAMEDVAPYQCWDIVRSILMLVFEGSAMPATMVSEQLSKDQRVALQAIANSKNFWQGFNVTKTMQVFGLPQSQGCVRTGTVIG